MKKKTILSVFAFAALALFTASCTNDDATNQKVNDGYTTFATRQPSVGLSTTSTSMQDHLYQTGMKFVWEKGDHIWVEQIGGNRIKSTATNINGTQEMAQFLVPGTITNSDCPVYYTGALPNDDGYYVTIANTQTQPTPNNSKHFGTSGDCGTATAGKVGDTFEFMLDHKASYLCFLLRISNAAQGRNCYLQKIVVKSSDKIAGRYQLDLGGLKKTEALPIL